MQIASEYVCINTILSLICGTSSAVYFTTDFLGKIAREMQKKRRKAAGGRGRGRRRGRRKRMTYGRLMMSR